MIQKLFHRLLEQRHFWRYATFSEVAELYASRMMRMLAVNIAASFMSIFLYQNGYSLQVIAMYWAAYYVFKACIALPAARYAAAFGPKHGILLSNLLYIPSMLLFSQVPAWGVPALIATGVLQGLSATLYSLCHLIDFSKVKNVDHAGKEIAYMNIAEKLATGASPLIGGLLAFLAGPQVTMWAAAVLFACASVPLFRTGEPIPTHKKLAFRGFPWRIAWRSFIAESAIGFDFISSGTIWSLFVAVGILGVTGNQVYAQLGALLSVILVATLVSSYIYGKVIDRRKGGQLLRLGVLANTLVHLCRPFVTSPAAVVAVNAANESATTGYNMAFIRGMFDTADLSGHRVTYLGLIEVSVNIGAALAGLTMLLMVSLVEEELGLRVFFYVAAIVSLIIMAPKFRLYRR